MATIFITGSADGLGQLAAIKLVNEGHRVVLHARNSQRAKHAMAMVPGAEGVLTGDLSVREEAISLAGMVNESGSFDAIIHNAAVYHAPGADILAVNTLAPYILTCLIRRPGRLIYMSSGMHLHGRPNLEQFSTGRISYSDSKLHDLMLAMAVARKWPGVYANAVNPGWVPTKMGGAGAPDDLQKGFETQVWLATGEDARVSGRYFFHKKEAPCASDASSVRLQEQLLARCEEATGIRFPG